METFLSKLADELRNQPGMKAGELCVVFPSRRAPIFFQEIFSRSLNGAKWIPDAYSFEDFLCEVSGKIFADPLTLAFELYPFYREVFPEESFDKYYSWAGVLLQDFEETDQSLVDVRAVFANLHKLKELDATIDSWDKEDEPASEYRNRFLELWKAIPDLYERLSSVLRSKELSTPGLALKDLLKGDELQNFPWKKVWFAGFGSFTKAEEKFISTLIDSGKAECRWDLDQYYFGDEKQEAGKFFRALQKRWKGKKLLWVSENLLQDKKTIKVIGVAGRAAQAKAASILMESLGKVELGKNSAVILPDENLLFPLLHSLPEQVKEINVTMGYPLRGTPLFALIDSFLQIHEGAAALAESRKKYHFYHKDVNHLLRHPYFKAINPEAVEKLDRLIRDENLIYISPEDISALYAEEDLNQPKKEKDLLLLKAIFSQPRDQEVLVIICMALLNELRAVLENRSGDSGFRTDTELELLFHFRALIVRLRDRLDAHRNEINLKTFRRVFREVIRQASIPFTGEPLMGLQVMGVLEARALDFDNLVVLSVNEGLFPANSRAATFLPFSLRKAFGMPTFEEKDGLYAWNFYRMIQRAKNITLIWNTEPDLLGGGERSRFIEQIQFELLKKNLAIEWTEEQMTFESLAPAPKPIPVSKTESILESLRIFSTEKGFSPSALNTYLACPLQFYLRYVERLRAKDQVEESAEADTFGKVFHGVMETLYSPFIGKSINKEIIENLISEVDSVSVKIFKKEGRTRNLDFGKNHLLLGVIRELVLKTLELDAANSPFHLIALEKQLEMLIEIPEGKIKVKGILDRLQEKKGIATIVDYKTGDTGSLKMEEPQNAGESTSRKEAFQLACYALLFLSEDSEFKQVIPGIISLRNLSKGLQTLEFGVTGESILNAQNIQPFKNRISEIIREILNPEMDFSQTEELENCSYCDFKVICNRQ